MVIIVNTKSSLDQFYTDLINMSDEIIYMKQTTRGPSPWDSVRCFSLP